jgi:hypothetical protein
VASDEGAVGERGDGDAPRRGASIAARLFELASSPRGHLLLGLVAPMVALFVNVGRVYTFTVDDSYISYRYARNLADGLGLVYNPGERIEGYTNFLWTVILAGGLRVGVDPNALVKVLGSLAAAGSLGLIYRLSSRLRPFGALPCVATWLFASTIVSVGYSVFGLETGFFVFLVLAGIERMFVETERGRGFVASGLLFALAGLTRPEAPMYLGVPMLWLGRRLFSGQNLARGTLFAAAIAAHALWRHSYYGTWLPNTLSAKTGDLDAQLAQGTQYLHDYLAHAGPALWLGLAGLGVALARRSREGASLGALALAVLAYVTLVGGDWMPYFRFLAPFEPLCFLLVDLAARSLADVKDRAVLLALLVFGGATAIHRANAFTVARAKIIKDEKVFWDSAAGGAARWFREHGTPGAIAIADIGQVGYETNYPILDLLGLVDPVISKLPGGYTRKTGEGYVERVFEVMPRYFVLVGSQKDCKRLPFPAQMRLYRDPRFQGAYENVGSVRHSKDGLWCIFERTKAADSTAAPKAPKAPAAPEAASPDDG